MPAKSAKQQRFMGACAHGANYSGCPSKEVAEEFAHKKPKKSHREMAHDLQRVKPR